MSTTSQVSPSDVGIPIQISADQFTGAGATNIGFDLPQGRNGLTPEFGLAYGSARRQGAFGRGWSLAGLPTIGIDADGGLPGFDGKDGFSTSLGGSLVPDRDPATNAPVTRIDGPHKVEQYRTQQGGTRVRFERWVHQIDNTVHWRTRDTADTVTIYGHAPDGSSRIADPAAPRHIYQWLPELTVGARGDAIAYSYGIENLDGGAGAILAEQGRKGAQAQRYLRRVRWANLAPATDPATFDVEAEQWAFQAVFDFGDHDMNNPAPVPDGIWPARPDPFSVCTPGFEVRTWRLCRRILVFHQFNDLGPNPVLVEANTFTYDARPDGSLLTEITKTGYRHEAGNRSEISVPPLGFGYTEAAIEAAFVPAQQSLQATAPAGVSNASTVLVDLYGEGLPGLLQDNPEGWYFQRNLGGGRFAAPVCVQARPAHSLTNVRLGDFDGDGNMDAVVMSGQGAGHYRFDREAGEWSTFQPFDHMPTLGGNGVERLDLTGDGRGDLLIRETDGLRIYEARGTAGFSPEAQYAKLPALSAVGPAGAPPLASNPATDYLFADMTGDGLFDQVLIRSGLVAYWPNLGRGKFGPPVLMADAPVMNIDGRFAIDRVLLADLDGSGTADLIFLGIGEIRIWTNAAGNSFTGPRVLGGLPVIDSTSVLDVLDISGDGRMSLVWTQSRQNRIASYQTLALSGPVPPGLLREVTDSMGRRDTLVYGHSASHFLRDQGTVRAWSTHLPSHTTTVDAVVTEDLVAGARYETRYAYRNGAFDSRTRRFAGFGEVDATASQFVQADTDPLPVCEPALTRSFLDQGLDVARPDRFWTADPDAVDVPSFTLDRSSAFDAPDPETLEDARACLRGRMLRQEVYKVGENGPSAVPMAVSQTGYVVRIEQPAVPRSRHADRRRAHQRAALACVERETSSALYEGVADDPRVSHGFILEQDDQGSTTLAASLSYPRRAGIPTQDAGQSRLVCDIKRKTVHHDINDTLLSLNTDIAQEEFTLSGLTLPGRGYFRWAEITAAVGLGLVTPLRHDQAATSARARRSSSTRNIYWNAAGNAALPVGQVSHPARLHHTESAVFSVEFAVAQYGAGRAARLEGLGHWQEAGHWWRASEAMTYLPEDGFFLPTGHVLTDGTTMQIDYDAALIFPVGVTDPIGARGATEIDYQALAPRRTLSATGAWTQTQYDALGIAVRGVRGGTVVDGNGATQLHGFDALAAAASLPDIAAALADPAAALGGALQVLAYDLDAFADRGAPTAELQIFAGDLPHDGTGGSQTTGQISVEIIYRDGHGQPISSKRRVDGGLAVHRDGGGAIVMVGGAPDQQVIAQRWLASGWVQRNQKGETTRSFEPYFSDRHDYEDDAVLKTLGTAAQQFSDCAGRMVQMLAPNGTMERVEYGVWHERHFDSNDTVDQSAWHLSREILPAGHPENRALQGTLPHADTPVERIFDSAGRQVRLRETDDQAGQREIRTIIDDDGDAARIIDARGIETSRHIHDMAGRKIIETLADAGTTKILYDARDNAVEVTNADGLTRLTTFDAMDRILAVDIDTGTGTRRIEAITYADDVTDADVVGRNLLGLPVAVRDEAGLHSIFDATPQTNPTRTATRLIADATLSVDWAVAVALEPQEFVMRVTHDAMGRPTHEIRPDGSVVRAQYADGGALAAVFVSTEDGQVGETPVLVDASYSVMGQRETAQFGNGVAIRREYERETQLVRRIMATRSAAGGRAPLLQDLNYTYDPVGNITACVDLAHDPAGGAASAFFTATPGASAARFYTYDAHYRLISCEGRAHSALTGSPFHTGPVSLSDGSATERFTQQFNYDASNNLTRLRHMGVGASYTVDFWVDATSNRSRPVLNGLGQPVANPAADFGTGGELRRLDHLEGLEWRHDQRLSRAVVIDRSAQGLPDDDEVYLYDGGGTRLRRVTRRMLADTSVESTEVTYLSGAEIRRVYRGNVLILERFVTRISDGLSDIAELHRWSRDETGRETDDITQNRLQYTLGDHLGSATVRLDDNAGIISYEEFLPYGQRAFASGDDAREMALKVYGFIGRERDAATGLHHIGQRYYASWLCRWMSPDPAGEDDGPNLYQYAQSNPVTFYDPTGLQATDGREQGTITAENWSVHPPEVIAAIRALPAEKKREYAALLAVRNFTYYIGYDGVIHMGTVADMTALARAGIAANRDVVVVTVSGADGSPDGNGTGSDASDPDPVELQDFPTQAPAGNATDGQGSEDGEGSTQQTGGQNDGTGTGGDGADRAGHETGTEDGQGARADSDENGEGGSGTSQSPDAVGTGTHGTGIGGGTGDPNRSGNGTTPGARRPGGTGTANGTGTRPGGRQGGVAGANGTNPNASGMVPNGVEGGTGSDPGGAAGGQEGGVAGGTSDGSLDGSSTGSAGGTLPDDGSGPQDGNGGDRSAPTGSGRGPEGAGSSDQGTGNGSGQGTSQPDSSGGESGDGGAQEPATLMDHVVTVAGWWNFEFSPTPGGGRYGIPGGMGSLNLGRWGQAAYVALTVVDIALTIVTLGGLAAIKTGLKIGLKALASVGRKALAALTLKNLRRLAVRASSRLSIYGDNILKWLASDYIVQGRFFNWMMSKGGWRARVADSFVGRWFLYGMNAGASAGANGTGKFLGFWKYQRTVVTNNATRLADKVDNFFHEGTHVLTDLLLFPVNGLRDKLVRGQPVFAVFNYLDEVAAYSMGRIGSLRLHALPLAPVNAFSSVYSYYHHTGGQAMARAAIAWSVAGVTAIGGAGYGAYRYFTRQDDLDPQAAP